MNKTIKKGFGTGISYLFLVVCCIFTIYPLLFMLSLSLRTRADIIRNSVLHLPEGLHFENYVSAWVNGHFSTYFRNSVIISAWAVIGVIFLSTLIAYAMSYYAFKGKKLINTVLLLGLIIPFEVIIIPLYYNMKAVGLLGSRAGVYSIQIALNIPLAVFILKGFIDRIPKSFVESARMDGASEWLCLTKIVLPLIIPAELSIVILIFMWTWNDFMLPNIMIRSDAYRTLPLGLAFFKGKFSRDIPLTSAACVIIMLPILLLYLILQKYMVEGLTVGGVKE